MAGMEDRRSDVRLARMLSGKVLFNDITRDCTILDLSRSGARLKLSGFSGLPGKFDLFVPDRGVTYRVHVQWQFGGEVGVAFDLGEAGSSEQADLVQRIEQLERSLSELRRFVMARLERTPGDQTAA